MECKDERDQLNKIIELVLQSWPNHFTFVDPVQGVRVVCEQLAVNTRDRTYYEHQHQLLQNEREDLLSTWKAQRQTEANLRMRLVDVEAESARYREVLQQVLTILGYTGSEERLRELVLGVLLEFADDDETTE